MYNRVDDQVANPFASELGDYDRYDGLEGTELDHIQY
jgi:hypothetical protein